MNVTETAKKWKRNFHTYFIIFLSMFTLSTCCGYIHGTVIDAETGKPIQGAVAHASWDIQYLLYASDFYSGETLTDKYGRFSLFGLHIPVICNSPAIAIYKNGYIGWREHVTFPDRKKREWTYWRIPKIYRLERFVEGAYSHHSHWGYIHHIIISTGLLSDATLQEGRKASKESDLYGKKYYIANYEKKSAEQVMDEVLKEMYNKGKDYPNAKKNYDHIDKYYLSFTVNISPCCRILG